MKYLYTKPQGLTVWEHTQTGEVEVARIVGTSRPVTARRAEARLFAAAPDLLKALVDLIDDLGEPEDGVQANLMDAARAAIAKAERGAT